MPYKFGEILHGDSLACPGFLALQGKTGAATQPSSRELDLPEKVLRAGVAVKRNFSLLKQFLGESNSRRLLLAGP